MPLLHMLCYMPFVCHMCFIQCWVNFVGLLEFHIAHSKILLTDCVKQLLYYLSLIILYFECAKQKAAIKTASNACSLLAKH